ncbi:hypothetical protein ACFQV2_00695 [Actinokineospora soli]|uniref:Peptidase inhibitor family I36 n=1 Tax=Actinokineospora soli TaxID=1048753 RepID=A0ABW2TII5_9PSEU
MGASPAHAYGTLIVRYAVVDTDNCARLAGSLSVSAQGDYCVLNDSADDTFFHKDPGGVAIKVEEHDSNGMVAKQEFHPYGETLWVYDTRNDGDTVYTDVYANGFYGPYAPPGTSNTIDFAKVNLDFPEGRSIRLDVYDDAGPADLITSVGGGVA